jgi:hypothetical protein
VGQKLWLTFQNTATAIAQVVTNNKKHIPVTKLPPVAEEGSRSGVRHQTLEEWAMANGPDLFYLKAK